MFNKKEMRYLLLLLLDEFKCLDRERLKKCLAIKTDKTITINIKKAEEKLLINKSFREEFFYLQDKVEKKIE